MRYIRALTRVMVVWRARVKGPGHVTVEGEGEWCYSDYDVMFELISSFICFCLGPNISDLIMRTFLKPPVSLQQV